MTTALRMLIAVVLICLAASDALPAPLTNGGFETGVGGWSSLGVTQAEALTTNGFSSTTGTDSAVLETRASGVGSGDRGFGATSNYATVADIANDLNVIGGESAFHAAAYPAWSGNNGDLGVATQFTRGSAIYQTFDASANETMSFDFLFLSNLWDSANGSFKLNSAAFVVLNGEVSLLYQIRDFVGIFQPNVGLPGPGHVSGYDYAMDPSSSAVAPSSLLSTATPSYGFSPLVGGSNTLGFVILGTLDDIGSSGLLIDNIAINAAPGGGGPSSVPEPSSMTLLAFGAIGFAGRRIRRRQKTLSDLSSCS